MPKHIESSLIVPTSTEVGNPEHIKTNGTKSPIYTVWVNVKQRCYNISNPQYKDYGGRGITMCEEWKHSFKAFYKDMGDCPKGMTLERIDNDKGYCRDNCKWATWIEQANNRRIRVSGVRVSKNGITLSIAEWCRRIGVNPRLVYVRVCRGWTHEEALSIHAGKFGAKTGW